MKYRLLSILLAFCMVVMLVPSAALADGPASVQVGSASAKVGETVRIPVTLTSNPGIAGAMFDISYPENLLTLTAIEKGAVFSGGNFAGNIGKKNVQWYDVSSDANTTATGPLFTLVFDVIDSGSAAVTVNLSGGEPTNLIDLDAVSVPVTFLPGTVTVISDVVVYTVTFDANGGKVTPAAVSTGADGKLTELPLPTRDGYTFDGWYTAADSGVKVDESKIYMADTTLYARWTKIETPPEHVHNWLTVWSNDAAYHWHECGASDCPVTVNSGKDGYSAHVYSNDMDTTCNTCGYTRTVTPSTPEHTHSWATAWTRNETHHWYECNASGCPITANSGKAEYGAHTYNDDEDTTCNICGYIRTVAPSKPDKEDTETYYISIPSTKNGEVIPSTRYAASGERVTLSVHPDKDYELDKLTVTDMRGRELSLRDLGSDRYSFTMPGSRVTVEAVFTGIGGKEKEETPAPSVPGTNHTTQQPDSEIFTGLGTPGISGIVLNPAPMPFTDVRAQDWFYSNVDYVWKHYLMSGVTETTFEPDTSTSRAMIWTVLARMNNVQVNGTGNLWYEKGQQWAMTQGVTDGTDPLGSITREQLATMLWRNAGQPGGTGDLSGFGDGSAVSDYAVTAIRWAVGAGILNGSNGNLEPQGTATRAQVAAMVMRYGERIGA